jgi:hypothetical protein
MVYALTGTNTPLAMGKIDCPYRPTNKDHVSGRRLQDSGLLKLDVLDFGA